MWPNQNKSENPKVFRKFWSQVVKNTVRSLKQIQLIIFEKYSKRKIDPDFRDRWGAAGIAYSSSWIELWTRRYTSTKQILSWILKVSTKTMSNNLCLWQWFHHNVYSLTYIQLDTKSQTENLYILHLNTESFSKGFLNMARFIKCTILGKGSEEKKSGKICFTREGSEKTILLFFKSIFQRACSL